MKIKKNFYLGLLVVLFCFITQQSAYTQTEFKKMVDASAKTLPYDEYTISVLTQKLENKMYEDFGWQDKVLWIKGIVQNLQKGAIDGKCGTKKGETFYFRTVIKDVYGDVLWDFDSFSKNVLANAENVKAKQQNRLNYYQKNLDNLRDSLKNYYSGKYEPIYKDLVVKCDSLIKEYDKYFSGSTIELLKLECGPYGYADYLEDLTEIFNSIILDCEDFKNSKNPEAFYNEKVKIALIEVHSIDSTVMYNFSISEKRYKSYKSRVEQEINEVIAQKEEENKKKDLIAKLESNMPERIVSVSQFIGDKKNRDLVNELYQNGNQEQKIFYDNYLKVYDSQQLVSEFKVLIFMAANDDYKLQRLTNWNENLKYWESKVPEK
jgi:hypothetical protein